MLPSCNETGALGLFNFYTSADVGQKHNNFLAIEFLHY